MASQPSDMPNGSPITEPGDRWGPGSYEESHHRYDSAWDALWLLGRRSARLDAMLVELHHAMEEWIGAQVRRALDLAGIDNLQDELILLDILAGRS